MSNKMVFFIKEFLLSAKTGVFILLLFATQNNGSRKKMGNEKAPACLMAAGSFRNRLLI